MTIVDWASVIGTSVVVSAAGVATVRAISRWQQGREDEEVVDTIRLLLGHGKGQAFEPPIGSREHRSAERLVTKGRLLRVGTVYLAPVVLKRSRAG